MKCMYCGGEVLVQPGSSIGICTCCMAENPLPKDEKINRLYEKAGTSLRESRFDEAKELFQKLLIENPQDAAVCWGLALSEYGIEYVTDPATGEQLPTLHRLSMQKFSEYLYAKKAVELSWNSLDRDFYIKQSSLIDSIQVKSLSISSQETPVDVFICYKRSEEGEKRTADSRMAADYYRELTRRGYQVFFAEETLKAGEEYEPRIFAALQSAKVLIAVASKQEYYEAVWVKNEWSRYAALIEQDLREKGSTERLLIPVFQHMKREELPAALRKMPSYVEMMTSADPKSELLNLVAAHFERGKAENVSDILREVRTGGMSPDASRKGGEDGLAESAEKTRTLAVIRLVNKEYTEAEELFLRALGQPGGEEDPENWLGLMMSSLKVPGREALGAYAFPIDENEYFQKALACASEEKKQELRKIADNCRENQAWFKKTENKRGECEGKVRALIKQKAGAGFGELEKRCAGQKKLLEESVKQKPAVIRDKLLFLIPGNVLPLIALCYITTAVDGNLGALLTIMLLIQPVIYGIYIWRFLSARELLDSGCVTYLIRLVVIGFVYWLVMLIVSVPMNHHLGIPFTILVTLAAAVYSVKLVSGFAGQRKRIREGMDWAARQKRDLSELEEKNVSDLCQQIEAAAEAYRKYYVDFDSRMKEWREQARKAAAEKTRQLQEKLEQCERGML